MLCRLSRKRITIAPIYVLNHKRKSYGFELKAIAEILKRLSRHPATKASFAELKIIDLDTVQIDPKIFAARRRLATEVGLLGYQYDYLASIAKNFGTIGLGLEKAPDGIDIGAPATLIRLAKLKSGKFGYEVDQACSKPDINTVFGNFFFPIIDVTEREMKEWVVKNNYQDIMNLIWFCHSPINGQPCGLCRPCEEKMDSKMNYLLPKKAQRRYFAARKWDFLGEKLSRSIKKSKLKLLRSFGKNNHPMI